MVILVVAMSTTAYASNAVNWEHGTDVTYIATATEHYTITVPARLAPGETGDVIAEGAWPTNRVLIVDADDIVRLTNSIDSNEYKELQVEFNGMYIQGSTIENLHEEADISVSQITKALFGVWSGTFEYSVSLTDHVT